MQQSTPSASPRRGDSSSSVSRAPSPILPSPFYAQHHHSSFPPHNGGPPFDGRRISLPPLMMPPLPQQQQQPPYQPPRGLRPSYALDDPPPIPGLSGSGGGGSDAERRGSTVAYGSANVLPSYNPVNAGDMGVRVPEPIQAPMSTPSSLPPHSHPIHIPVSAASPIASTLAEQQQMSGPGSARRRAHIVSEQRRRENINTGFEELKAAVPSSAGTGDSKALILRKAVQHIQSLEARVASLKAQLAAATSASASSSPSPPTRPVNTPSPPSDIPHPMRERARAHPYANPDQIPRARNAPAGSVGSLLNEEDVSFRQKQARLVER